MDEELSMEEIGSAADELWPGGIYKRRCLWAKNTNMKVYDLFKVSPDGATLKFVKQIEESPFKQ